MQIRIRGEMTIAALRQAIYEQLHHLEDDLAVRHVRDITLYLTPTNGFGHDVVPHNKSGREVSTLYSGGAYRSAAAEYHL